MGTETNVTPRRKERHRPVPVEEREGGRSLFEISLAQPLIFDEIRYQNSTKKYVQIYL